jgi:hypothetical protein
MESTTIWMIVIILLIVGGVIGLFIYNAVKPKTVLPSSPDGDSSDSIGNGGSSGSSSGGSSDGSSGGGSSGGGSSSTTSDSCSGECKNLKSQNGIFRTIVDGGNFILYKDTEPIWNSKTFGQGKAPYKLVMKTDGDLVLYDSTQKALWNSGTSGVGISPYTLTLQNDGILKIFDSTKREIWNYTYGSMGESSIVYTTSNSCSSGESGECKNLKSPNGIYRAVLQQTDGNFVLYKDTQATWNSRTYRQGKAPYKLTMQTDGNLVLRDSTLKVLWQSGSSGRGTSPYTLTLQNDGKLRIFDSENREIWDFFIDLFFKKK